MAWGRWGFLALLVGVPLAACSLSDGVEDLQGGGGRNGAAGRPGGAGASMGAAGAQAGGGAAGGASERPPCAPGVGSFCAEFDASRPGDGWTGSDVNGFGMGLALVPRDDEAGRALRATAEPSDDGDERGAMVRQSLGRASSVRCEVDLFIEEYDDDAEVDLLTLSFVVPGFSNYEVTFGLLGDGEAGFENFRVDDQGDATFPSRSVAAPPEGVWYRVALEVDPSEARLYYGPTQMASLPLELENVAATTVALGITWMVDSDDLDLRFDHLACTYREGGP